MERIVIEKRGAYAAFFDLMQWAVKARGENQGLGFDRVYIGKNRVVCCDGNLISMFRHNRTFERGTYEVSRITKKVIELHRVNKIYPDLAYAVRSVGKGQGKELFYSQTRKSGPGAFYTTVVRAMEENYTLNYNRFSLIVSDGNWKIKIKPDGGAVVFKSGQKTAVLMPMLINW